MSKPTEYFLGIKRRNVEFTREKLGAQQFISDGLAEMVQATLMATIPDSEFKIVKSGPQLSYYYIIERHYK